MPEATVTAVVLRRADAGENDRRLTLFTRELGKIEAVAKGARKGGSRLAGVSEPLTVAELQIAFGRVRNFVTQAQPISSLPKMRESYERLLCGLAIAELVTVHFPLGATDEAAFDRLSAALAALGGDSEPPASLVWFAARTLADEGLMPDWNASAQEAQAAAASIATLEKPPKTVKHAAACSRLLHETWRGVLDSPLPAWEAAVRAIKGNGV